MVSCVTDPFYLFEIAGVLNILLFLNAWVKFESFWVRIVFAFDLSLTLMYLVGLYVADIPTEIVANLFVAAMFTAGFYVLSPQLWGAVFLLVGLISMESFWDPLWSQICSFSRHSLNTTMEQTNSKVALAGFIVFVLFVIGMSLIFAFPRIQLVVFGFVLAAKAVIGFRFIEIRVFEHDDICCNPDSPRSLCPIWFTGWHWVAIFVLTAWRIWFNKYIAKHEFCGMKRTGYNLLTSEKPNPETTDEGEEDDDEPGETKPTVSLRKVKGKAPTVQISN